jgi:hypothetical protein
LKPMVTCGPILESDCGMSTLCHGCARKLDAFVSDQLLP